MVQVELAAPVLTLMERQTLEQVVKGGQIVLNQLAVPDWFWLGIKMAYWAEIDENNFVIQVLVLGDDKSSDWLVERFGGTWIQTSYNTRGGIHFNPETGEPSSDQSKALRKNPAGIGHTYDSELDAFIPPKPFDSWVLDEETAQWEAPVEYPTDGKDYSWDEETTSWVEIPQDEE
jgi:hypothetical protein